MLIGIPPLCEVQQQKNAGNMQMAHDGAKCANASSSRQKSLRKWNEPWHAEANGKWFVEFATQGGTNFKNSFKAIALHNSCNHDAHTHTLTHSVDRMTLSSVRTCTHYAYAVSAKKRTWRQGQCAAAEEEVQNLQSVEADALHVSLRNNPIKGSPEKEKRNGEGEVGSELDRAQLGQFMQVDLADIYEQRAVRQTWTASN